MKIAVIGAGNWGKNLVRTFHALGHLGPVVEPFADHHPNITAVAPTATIFTDHSPLLRDPAITAVAIATPASTHHQLAKAFLLAGKDVFVEKPIALSVADAQDLHQTATQENKILMVGHLLLYHPAITFIRDYLKTGELGTLFTLHQQRSKLGRARDTEDALWSLGVHDVAVLLHLVGSPPLKVTSYSHAGLQPSIADDVYLHLDFANGVKATLHNSWLWPEDSRFLRIIGSRAMLVYDDKTQEVMLHRKSINSNLTNQDQGTELLFKNTAEPLAIELKHFIDCVIHRTTPLSDSINGIDVLKVLAQATP